MQIMRLTYKKISIIAFATFLFGAGTVFALNMNNETAEVLVYKSPTCSCCTKWISHLNQNGFKVKSVDVNDIRTIKTKYGIDSEVASCHTSIIGNYVVEGHVPIQAIQKLLKEQPNIHGISVPGMPIGSPGMEGPNPKPYSVYSFGKNGAKQIFMEID